VKFKVGDKVQFIPNKAYTGVVYRILDRERVQWYQNGNFHKDLFVSVLTDLRIIQDPVDILKEML